MIATTTPVATTIEVQGRRPYAARQRSIQVVADQSCEHHPNRNLMGDILASNLSSSQAHHKHLIST